MRIISGTAKGRKLKAVGHSRRSPLRPTSSKVRESIFNIIGSVIEGARFLDLYAGSATMGFEALSRGAALCTFVEVDRLRVRGIKRVANELGFSGQTKIYRMKTLNYLKMAKKESEYYDVIFMDPPYLTGEYPGVMSLLAEGKLLSCNGLVIVEHSSKKILPDMMGKLKKKKSYAYGDTSVTTYVLYGTSH
jgi:16S rRNA (guanine(966)-N(2))-methyltransferase RsmD